jgi:hypothetical protein
MLGSTACEGRRSANQEACKETIAEEAQGGDGT